MDLHIHTPASADYRDPNVTYLDILQRAEAQGLDIIAFTDHNTVAGYKRFLDEIAALELLERLNRLTAEERERLQEFRRLREKILILPGFEFTATLGFHILGIFPPETTVRELEHLLLNLNVPSDRLDVGSGEVGATTDVLTAYRLINQAGGLVIAAHANSSHGVAMPGFDFGGQTRIAYTQDENLHALEVTDLTSKSRRRTQLFFSGTKPEYPRRMHCIQGSDAHRLHGIPGNNQELGVGDRPTEILLDEVSFDAIYQVFLGKDFAKTRPFVPTAPQEFDPLHAAREEGDTLVQAFHESIGKHGVDRRILQDVVALANTNGGTIYIGASANVRKPVQGVPKPSEAARQLKSEIAKHIVPPLEVQIDIIQSAGKPVLQIIVPRGSEVPYALDSTQIFVRSENETSLAVRDEIVNLVRDVVAIEFAAKREVTPGEAMLAEPGVAIPEAPSVVPEEAAAPRLTTPPPHTGVEIVSVRRRAKGDAQYTMRDLRNNRIIHNVTRASARKLWQYAISEFEKYQIGKDDAPSRQKHISQVSQWRDGASEAATALAAQVSWLGDIGLLKAHQRAGKVRYDLVQRDADGVLHIYYGVTDDGIHGAWKDLIESLAGTAPVHIVEEETDTTATPEVYDMPPDLEQVERDSQGRPEEAPQPAFGVSAVPPLEIAEAPMVASSHAEAGGVADASLQPSPESVAASAPAAVEIEMPRLLFTPGRSLLPPFPMASHHARDSLV